MGAGTFELWCCFGMSNKGGHVLAETSQHGTGGLTKTPVGGFICTRNGQRIRFVQVPRLVLADTDTTAGARRLSVPVVRGQLAVPLNSGV